MQIAIDGPVAAGKGTVAYLLSKKLKALYVDTGAMYRAVGLAAIQNNISLNDEKKIVALLKKNKINLEIPPRGSKYKCLVKLNDVDVSGTIRTPEISKASSIVAALPKVRKILVALQKNIAKNQSVVMEGRDITTKVLKNADLKIYLTASPEVRAKRRKIQLEEQGIKVPLKEVLKDTIERDKQDSTRKADPLKISKDSWVVDTTNLTINQVVKKIELHLKDLR
jgi:CMP/dCMP kinase